MRRAMPTYEYRCENGHLFEVMQRMTDEPITACETCGAPVQRVYHPIAVHFKGKGFYNTDYGTAKRTRENAAAAEKGADKTADKAAAKSEAKSADKGSSGSSSAEKPSSSGSSDSKPASGSSSTTKK